MMKNEDVFEVPMPDYLIKFALERCPSCVDVDGVIDLNGRGYFVRDIHNLYTSRFPASRLKFKKYKSVLKLRKRKTAANQYVLNCTRHAELRAKLKGMFEDEIFLIIACDNQGISIRAAVEAVGVRYGMCGDDVEGLYKRFFYLTKKKSMSGFH